MNVSDLTDAVHGLVGESANVNKRQVAATVGAVFDAIMGSLKRGERVGVTGFGIFDVRETQAKKGKSPANGLEIDIPAGRRATFKAGKGLKDAVKP